MPPEAVVARTAPKVPLKSTRPDPFPMVSGVPIGTEKLDAGRAASPGVQRERTAFVPRHVQMLRPLLHEDVVPFFGAHNDAARARIDA